MIIFRLAIALALFSSLYGCREGGDKNVEDSKASDSTVDSDTEEDTAAVDADGDGHGAAGDCDDANPLIHPGAEEICDGLDNDCDGSVDGSEAVDAPAWYSDADGDGYGNDSETLTACDEPRGYSEYSGDCDDADAAFHPGALEADCTDPQDYNCDGSVGYADLDGDGFAACEDCDDTESAVNEAGAEVCNDIDDDCDGLVDSDDPDLSDATTWYGDSDGDGYGGSQFVVEACEVPAGYVDNTEDCNDLDPMSFPGAAEVCDEADNDCDGDLDEGVGFTWYADIDGDGYGDASSTTIACYAPPGYSSNGNDCNDNDPSAHPGSFEICDLVDNDCDGNVDEDDAINASDWYADTDGDGYGDALSSTSSCDMPTGYAANSQDCNDSDSGVSPAANESCDTVDNDCDGTVDEDDAINASTWYSDADGDGYGDASSVATACDAPSQHVANADDCNDDPNAGGSGQNPGLPETWYDGIDQDCDGNDDDQDGDGVALTDDCDDTDTASTVVATDADCDTVLTADDCNDGDATSTIVATDADCDTVLTADDCNDGDATSTIVATDADCDTVLTADDCNDSDASSTTVATDADCDAVLTADDCNDSDASSTTVATDGDCDGTLTADDCDDGDSGSNTVATDADCDGYESQAAGGIDCDDSDAASTTLITDADCDSAITSADCDDTDPNVFDNDGTTTACPGQSCLEILNNNPSFGDGNYWIQPGNAVIEVTCDMVTDGGGYTYYGVSGGINTSSRTANNSCKELGMDIVFPRTKAHWDSMLARYSTGYFPFIPGVYRDSGGGNYTGCAMKSGGCSHWRVTDGGQWWVRDSTYSEPNGDYSNNCWLGTRDVSNTSNITFNDGGCQYSGSSYICSTNDKP